MDAPGRTVSAIVESTNLDLKIVATLQERFAEVITTEQELRNIGQQLVHQQDSRQARSPMSGLYRRVAVRCGGFNRSVWSG
jgi:hypothetical protein